jgi:small subunit ribosomal protein S16
VIAKKMAVRIRLTRKGSKKKPYYRVVAADSEAPRDGRFLDILGTYNPMKEPAEVNLDREKVSKWLESGATASDSAKSILKKEGFKVTATTN